MIVEITKIPNSGKEFDLILEPSEIDLKNEFAVMKGETSFIGKIKYQDLRTFINGKIVTIAELSCNRCLRGIPQDLDFSFKNAYILAEDYTNDEESDLLNEGYEISIFEGNKIDLCEVAAEQIALDLPTQILCKDDCRGLCEKCGVNLNKKDCTCKENEVDPRWAALKDLKK